MEFLSLDGLHQLVRGAGWTKRDILNALETGQLVGMKIRTRRGLEKYAILHPGIEFIDYIKNPEARFAHVPLLSQNEVAVILGCSTQYVRWLVHKKKIKATHIDTRKQQGLRFTPESVRRYIICKTGKDPKQRAEPTAEMLIQWFWKVMAPSVAVDPSAVVDDDLRRIDELPEPERGQRIKEMLRLAGEARSKLLADQTAPDN